ncbi:MAG: hypoxanthine phosphoribosyltransferase [Bacteroidota bacterium]|nr:hypoxanthine phosphoribosyltransferase [Bacteroidota bacterium]
MYSIENKVFEKYISKVELQDTVSRLANSINKDYANKEVLFIVILNGAFVFASDLLRQINIPCQVSFVKVSTYDNEQSTNKFKQLIGLNEEIRDRHIIVVEDIVDTGFTMLNIRQQLLKLAPASIEIASLLFKPHKFKQDYSVKYIGFNIEDPFIIGYGLDLNGYGRNLPEIYQIKN